MNIGLFENNYLSECLNQFSVFPQLICFGHTDGMHYAEGVAKIAINAKNIKLFNLIPMGISTARHFSHVKFYFSQR